MVCPREVRDETGPLQYQMSGRSAGQWLKPSIVLKSRVNKCAAKFVNKSTSQPVDCWYSELRADSRLSPGLQTNKTHSQPASPSSVYKITIILYDTRKCLRISVKNSLFCASGPFLYSLMPPFWPTLRRQFAEAPGERAGPAGTRFSSLPSHAHPYTLPLSFSPEQCSEERAAVIEQAKQPSSFQIANYKDDCNCKGIPSTIFFTQDQD